MAVDFYDLIFLHLGKIKVKYPILNFAVQWIVYKLQIVAR